MLSVARWIPYLQRQEGITAKLVSNFMTLPLTLMAKATLTYKYTTEMSKSLDDIVYLPEYENRNILFVGHSLGGGLSKVLAHKYQFQSVSVSGPGITPIENYVLNKSRKNENLFIYMLKSFLCKIFKMNHETIAFDEIDQLILKKELFK